jgi:hypothetical protein
MTDLATHAEGYAATKGDEAKGFDLIPALFMETHVRIPEVIGELLCNMSSEATPVKKREMRSAEARSTP